MDDRKGIPKAVVLSAILHLGIVGFLFLAMLPCTAYDEFLTALHLPNPISCTPPPLELQGAVIEATLLGNTGVPPPRPVKAKPIPNTVPPPPSAAPTPPPTPPQEKVPVPTLPPPPQHPDSVDQEKVVQDALEKAQDATKEQEEKERQRQAELDAQAEKKKEAIRQYDALMAQANAINVKKLDSKAKQAQQQLADMQNAKDDGLPDLPNAAQRQKGNNSANSNLVSQYKAAIQNAVTQAWTRPDNMPATSCEVDIVQLPGGTVLSAKAASNCPYDEAGRRSVENAVLKAQPLPYKGFETVFSREIIVTFTPQ